VRTADRDFRVIAIIAAYNEGDIIGPVIGHLVENDVDVYLMDNDSTDDTVEQARHWLGRGLIEIESFPTYADPVSGIPGFDWFATLKRKEELARVLEADWFIHHDADEIRESPWPGMTLRTAIAWVDNLGYNCIDFRVLNFPPVDDGFVRGDDPRTHFTLYEEAAEHDRRQLNCWKGASGPLSLGDWGGHEVTFEGRREFPIRFLLRHYPIRSQEHGLRKVFAERKTRFLGRERELGWHHQYDGFDESSQAFLADPGRLKPFDLDRARLDLMLRDEVPRTSATPTEPELSEVNREHEVAGFPDTATPGTASVVADEQ
jgi:glycosyltransferase involved in cell wall biosynthesis